MTNSIPLISAAAVVFTFVLAGGVRADSWPQWRGPRGAGQAEGTGYPLTWSETENMAWKTIIPGRGWSSPVIHRGQVWLTTAMEIPCTPEQAKERLKANTSDQPLTLLAEVRLHAIGLDAATGKILHNVELFREKDPQWVHRQNTFASPTPVIEDGRLYAHFGTFGTACVDTKSGTILWTNNTIRLMHENGPGSSPILWRDKLIFHADGSDTQRVVALDKATGKVAWETPRTGAMPDNVQFKKSYATPLVIERDHHPILLSNGADWLYGCDPATGRELWKRAYGMQGFSLSALPVEAHGLVYYSTGFMKPELHAMRCRPGGEPELVWTCQRNVPTIPSPLPAGSDLFFVADSNICTSLNALTGAENYRERLGGDFNASPVFADGRIYVSNREGTTFVLAAGPAFKKLAENKLPGQQWASISAADRAFFLRTDTALYRLQQQ